MQHARRWTVATSATLATLLIGCQDQTSTPTSPQAEPNLQVGSSEVIDGSQYRPRPEEAEFAELAREIPGSAGFFFDEEGNLVVYLKDLGLRDKAKSKLEPTLRAQRVGQRPGGRVRRSDQVLVRQAQYDFFHLAVWRDRATDPVLDIPDVVFVDLNEALNRVQVGISDPAARPKVERKLAELGVPSEAVILEDTDPIVSDPPPPSYSVSPVPPTQSLQSYYRPLRGGLQIAFLRSDGQEGACTLGVVVKSGAGFLTNSHCTASYWARDSRSIYQHRAFGSSYYVGYETSDPEGSSCGFLSVNKCRNSDAALISIPAGVSSDFGFIMRTTRYNYGGRSGGAGSLEVDQANPRFQIVGKAGSSPYMGQELDKMGRTTGWTFGGVINTCVDTNGPGYRKLLCQVRATYYSAGGDSGSPVFDWAGQGYGNTVVLHGIHWGSAQDNSYAVFSPFNRIEMDFGPLSVMPSTGGGGTTPPPEEPCEPQPGEITCAV